MTSRTEILRCRRIASGFRSIAQASAIDATNRAARRGLFLLDLNAVRIACGLARM